MNLTDAGLDALLKRLNLANTRRIWPDLVVRAETEDWSYRQFLEILVGEEVARRQGTRLQRCTYQARFPFLKTIDDFDFQYQSQLRLSLLGSYLSADFVTEGRSLVLYGRSGRGKTHLAVAVAYRAIQNGFEALFTTAAALIDDLSRASRDGRFREVLQRYTRVHVLVIDEVGYLHYGPDAANVLYHLINERHLAKRPMILTTNKPLANWGEVLHDPDLAEAIVDRILERGRFLVMDGPSLRTRHIDQDQLPEPARISGKSRPEIPEPTHSAPCSAAQCSTVHRAAQCTQCSASAVRCGLRALCPAGARLTMTLPAPSAPVHNFGATSHSRAPAPLGSFTSPASRSVLRGRIRPMRVTAGSFETKGALPRGGGAPSLMALVHGRRRDSRRCRSPSYRRVSRALRSVMGK
jgi:DNA replication protein DnaC